MSGLVPEWPRTLSRLDSNTPDGVSRPIHLLSELAERKGNTQLMIILTDGSSVWEGSIDEEAMMEYAAKQDMNRLDYLSLSQQALTGKTNGTNELSVEDAALEFDLKSEDSSQRKVVKLL